MIFKQWILQFINEDSPTGDLAMDIQDDVYFPNTKIYGEMYDYLESNHASDLCLASFKEAWKKYKQEVYNKMKELTYFNGVEFVLVAEGCDSVEEIEFDEVNKIAKVYYSTGYEETITSPYMQLTE